MTSSNCYSSVYPFPIDLNQDDQHQHYHLNPLPLSPRSSSTSHLTCPTFFNPSLQDQPQPYDHQTQRPHDHQEEPLESPESALKLCIRRKTEAEGGGKGERKNESHHYESENNSAKWMSSKMRIMRKMMSSDVSNTNSSYNNNTVRICADCNTTKTPLWRSGPKGPKTLCNACGIRQRKARRAMAAAAAAGSVVPTTETKPKTKNKVQHKGKRSGNGRDSNFPPLKNKKCKLITSQLSQGRKKLCFEDLRIILSKHSAFPQDEKEAAILLMALSYGLVHG